MTDQIQHQDIMSDTEIEAYLKMSKDIREAAATMGQAEAQVLVSFYYKWQKDRIRAASRIKKAQERNEPHATIEHFFSNFQILERQARNALHRYAKSRPEGEWALSITGIGPVLAAGLMAYIDIDRAPYAGSLMTYAGQNPARKWLGNDASRTLIKSAFGIEGITPAGAMYHISQQANRRMAQLYDARIKPDEEPMVRERIPEEYLGALGAAAQARGVTGVNIADLWLDQRIQYDVYLDNAFRAALQHLGIPARYGYEHLYHGEEVDRSRLQKYLSRRPWNAELKVLCWKIGQSFVMTQSRDSDVYGKLYAQAKERYIMLNSEGAYADAAQLKLETTNIGKSTDAYKWYAAGKLPPAHIQARAERWARKMFLSHYWEVCYTIRHRKRAPEPYVIAHMGDEHNRYIPPPNFNPAEWVA